MAVVVGMGVHRSRTMLGVSRPCFGWLPLHERVCSAFVAVKMWSHVVQLTQNGRLMSISAQRPLGPLAKLLTSRQWNLKVGRVLSIQHNHAFCKPRHLRNNPQTPNALDITILFGKHCRLEVSYSSKLTLRMTERMRSFFFLRTATVNLCFPCLGTFNFF